MQIIETHSAARLIVCERTGRWAVALRRELGDAGIRVWETRTLANCREELAASPASFVVLELAGDAPGVIRFLSRQSQELPSARLAVVADISRTGWELFVREAGAVHFLTSPRHAGLLARLACRHLAQSPVSQQSLTERIWGSLPWADRRAKADSASVASSRGS